MFGQVYLYASRVACALLLMEIMTHCLYFNSITRYALWQVYGAQLQLNAVDVGMTGFWVLVFMWLKVSLICCGATPRAAAVVLAAQPFVQLQIA